MALAVLINNQTAAVALAAATAFSPTGSFVIDANKIKVCSLVLIMAAVTLSGCAALNPFSSPVSPVKKVTTTSDLDGNRTVIEEESYPQEVSDEIAKMRRACFDSFERDSAISDTVASKMESRDIKDVLVFREFRIGLREAKGFDPRQVCASPKSIYDYAIAHDQELYGTIRHGLSEAKNAAVSLGPWAAIYGVAKRGVDGAGDTSLGDNANVSNSFNKPTAINLGGQNSVTTATPSTEIVEQPEAIVIGEVK